MNEPILERKFNFTIADLCNKADLAYLGGVAPLQWNENQVEEGVISFEMMDDGYRFNIPSEQKPSRNDDSGYAFLVDGEEFSIMFCTKSILSL